MAEYTNVFASTMTVTVPNSVDYQDGGTVRSGVAEYTTATYPTVLGLQPSLGRWFDAFTLKHALIVSQVVVWWCS